MKTFEIIELSEALKNFTDKNKINDSKVRVAMIDNIIAVQPVVKEYESALELLRKEYTTPEVAALQQEIADLRFQFQNEKDETKKSEINFSMRTKSLAINDLQAPIEKDITASIKKIDEKDVKVTLSKVDKIAFDKATEKIENLPLKIFIHLRLMFK